MPREIVLPAESRRLSVDDADVVVKLASVASQSSSESTGRFSGSKTNGQQFLLWEDWGGMGMPIPPIFLSGLNGWAGCVMGSTRSV